MPEPNLTSMVLQIDMAFQFLISKLPKTLSFKGTKRKEFELRVAVFTGFTNEESKGSLKIENHKSEKLIIKRINN